ncbi:very short patch repair endonuclease [Mycolicibacterium fortuitum]|uniref:very short patch repair endonuclease n=1 Tax=Mycolicibacterium fortuitum TaxID=1766 RepID=UPI00096EBD9D|nr:very short patch repair endonuclease [Mycolicibacterium fortuitum]
MKDAAASWASTPAVRRSMQANRGRDTAPELAVRRIVHARGLRYYVDRRPLPELHRTADIVFPTEKVAVFIDGCFWHGCPSHHTAPQMNAAYWSAKVATNQARDADTDQRLKDAGWLPIRVWEHVEPAVAADLIEEIVKQRRTS